MPIVWASARRGGVEGARSGPRFTKGSSRVFEFARIGARGGRGHGFARGLRWSRRCGGERDARSAVRRQLRGHRCAWV